MTRVCTRCRKEYDIPDAKVCPEDGAPLYPVLETYTGDEAALRGRILDGRYRIEALLGEGGMGLVLRARHLFLDRPVAVKLLHPELLLVDEVKERFLREARTASVVRHERVVEISDFGVTPQGLHYLVMEHLTGEDLYDWSQERGRVDVRDALQIGAQTCEALAVIHRHGFVHRDLKPENIWLVEGDPGRVKLLDFGIAGVLAGDESSDADRLTRTGRALGTPNYMAPEQARAGALDGRADLYALGCVLWELVTAEVAFAGGSPMEVMTRQLQEMPRRPSEVVAGLPSWFDDLVLHALEKDPDERYPDADAMRAALEEGLARLAGDVPAPGESETGGRSTPLERPSSPRATQEQPLPSAQAERTPPPSRDAASPARRSVRWLLPLVGLAFLVGALALFRVVGGDEEAHRSAPSTTEPDSALAGPAGGPERTGDGEAVEEEAGDRVGAGADPVARPDATAPAAAEDHDVAETVVLQFRVEPDGTEVVRGEEVLGRTPLALPVERSGETASYTFRHEDREPLTLPVRHDRARTIEASLSRSDDEPEQEARRPVPRRAKPEVHVPEPTPQVRAPEPKPEEHRSGTTELMRPELPADGEEP
ncbi:MAG: protein kinase domain-containing protein [Myxococcota bacterium]